MSFISVRRPHFMYSYNKFVPVNFAFHLHQYYEILYVAGGQLTYIIENKEYSGSSGDIFITRPRELHTIVFNSDEEYERHFVQFDEEFLNFLSPTLLNRINHAAERHKILASTASEFNLYDFFHSLSDCISKKECEFDTLAQAYISMLLVGICKCTASSYSEPTKSLGGSDKIKQFLNTRFSSNLSLQEIADKLFLNKYYMCHMFKAETGMTIKEYIGILRFTYACKLHFEGKPLSEISVACGYSDYSQFYKSFIKYSGGLSPKKFFEAK